MLINLSNHPSEKWSREQKTAAQDQYGSILDIPFPPVAPELSREEVEELVLIYITEVQVIAARNPGEDITVHLAGEFNFVYQMLTELRACGIPAVSSTSERTVREHADGSKTIFFNFVRFREYYAL